MAQRQALFSISRAGGNAIGALPTPPTQPTSSAIQPDAEEGIGMFSCDLGSETLRWSEGTFALFGLDQGVAVDRRMTLDMYASSSRALLESVRERAIRNRSAFCLEAQIETGTGLERWIRISASVEVRGGQAVRLFGTKQDITAERQRLGDLERLAYTDAVTGLANRQRFQHAFLEPPPGSAPLGEATALVLFDLDGFKALNDCWGHLAGDACLGVFGARLREVFSDARLAARIGGDEFALILPRPDNHHALRARLLRALPRLNRPFDWQGSALPIHVSFGLALDDPNAPREPRQLFTLADADLYRAKALGGRSRRIEPLGCVDRFGGDRND
ncbi:diguanylate cyclase [Novosphingobium sp. 1949]|uniref:Diguanylate cyclase n=1 Tax=Novosphingobium organovorum TaxID=2930092 RepID=A0ABT0B9P8_9SPHN|nr:diguanylate cyclase [Novosphingobium organovorum]MCJ2181795.1 diguanylate cyclase [Novosphingobium organovorum]